MIEEITKAKETYETTLHPCSLEQSNVFGENLLSCGCYELDESTSYRQGEIVLYLVDENYRLHQRSKLKTSSGVLDSKFYSNYILAALSSEEFNLYSVDSKEGDWYTKGTCSKEGEGLFLSIDYQLVNNFSQNSFIEKVAVSTQSGSIVVFDVSNEGIKEELSFNANHKLFGECMPVWIVACNKHQKHSLLSGGDDCAFRLWDIRSNQAYYTNKSHHTAGVTCAEWSKYHEHLFVAGSYDETCAIWDDRQMKSPLISYSTGGGLWRTKWIRSEKNQDCLLTANMHRGLQLRHLSIQTSDESNQIQTEAEFLFSDLSEKQLTYGASLLSFDDDNKLHLAGCSFYDSYLETWECCI